MIYGFIVFDLVVLIVVVTILLRNRADAPNPVAQGEPGPVLILSGYGGNTDSLAPLVEALTEAGRNVSVVPPVGGGTGDLDKQAAALAQRAESLVTGGAESVDVIGYSAGGIVARLWVRDHGGDSVARRVLTLGSPHHGTDVARLALDAVGDCPAACQQLAPDSDLLRRLNSGDETPDGPLFISIYSAADRVVTPPESAVLDGALNYSVQSLCAQDDAAHRDLPGDPVVLASLGTVLGVGAPVAPSAQAACRAGSLR